MSKKLYEENSIKAIADAIRGKNGSTDTYKLSAMAAAITAIETGGSLPEGIATGTFQCAPATMTKEVSIEHGLGVIPSYVFVGSNRSDSSPNNQEIAFAVTYNRASNPHSYLLCAKGDIVDCTSSKTADTASNIYLPTNGGSAWYFLTYTYRWIAMV